MWCTPVLEISGYLAPSSEAVLCPGWWTPAEPRQMGRVPAWCPRKAFQWENGDLSHTVSTSLPKCPRFHIKNRYFLEDCFKNLSVVIFCNIQTSPLKLFSSTLRPARLTKARSLKCYLRVHPQLPVLWLVNARPQLLSQAVPYCCLTVSLYHLNGVSQRLKSGVLVVLPSPHGPWSSQVLLGWEI